MNLQDALLCIDCDWLYSYASSCPRCGSHVSYPVARAMDKNLAAVERMEWPPATAQVRSKPAPFAVTRIDSQRHRRGELRHSA